MFRINLMHRKAWYATNSITLYRLLVTPLLVYLVMKGHQFIFGWMLALSFFTDILDGFFARRFRVTSVFGSKLDSIADDLTILSAIAGVLVFKLDFLKENSMICLSLIGLYLVQTAFAFFRYGRISSFHTYLAKGAFLLQGSFLILLFLLPQPLYLLFYAAAIATALDLIEEIILVLMLKEWNANVKGIYWLRKKEFPEKKVE